MPKTKLTEADVVGIRYGHNEEEMSLGLLAHLYGVSRTQIWRIVNQKQRVKRLNTKTLSSLGSDSGEQKRLNNDSTGDLDLLKILKGRT